MPPVVSGTETGSFLLCLILKADLAISLILFPLAFKSGVQRNKKI